MKLAWPLLVLLQLLIVFCASSSPRKAQRTLRLKEPDLSVSLSESLPVEGRPNDSLKAAVFQQINRDRQAAGLSPVAWDEAAARVADRFCLQQVLEKTRGHFLMNGLPPYARTGFLGVFGVQSENSVSWITTAPGFPDVPEKMALEGQERMMAERPPHDGHRRTILESDATHVGVGWALERGRFQMAQEFLVRHLAVLRLSSPQSSPAAVKFEGRTVEKRTLQFVMICREPPPAPLTREEASNRMSYSYPKGTLAYAGEENPLARIVGAETLHRIRFRADRAFSFTFAPDEPGLYTFVFHTEGRDGKSARPGGSATLWFE